MGFSIPMPFPSFDRAAAIADIRDEISRAVRVGDSLHAFLRAAFPDAAHEAKSLGDAVAEYLSTGADREIQRLNTVPVYPPYGSNPETLAHLVEQRDRWASQLEIAERGLEGMRGNEIMAAMGDVYEATLIAPIRGSLANVESEISRIQSSMELEPISQLIAGRDVEGSCGQS